MGRGVRRVPPDWCHPVEEGQYKPLRQLEMRRWRNGEATHYQMYETTSEGTPISPVMEHPETLAHWLCDNQVSAFAGQTASYEAWLMVAQGRTVISGMLTLHGVVNGVEAAKRDQTSKAKASDAFSDIDNAAQREQQNRLERD